jgi:hypothetical protein
LPVKRGIRMDTDSRAARRVQRVLPGGVGRATCQADRAAGGRRRRIEARGLRGRTGRCARRTRRARRLRAARCENQHNGSKNCAPHVSARTPVPGRELRPQEDPKQGIEHIGQPVSNCHDRPRV